MFARETLKYISRRRKININLNNLYLNSFLITFVVRIADISETFRSYYVDPERNDIRRIAKHIDYYTRVCF